MKDYKKSQKQLIDELESLRKHILILEREKRKRSELFTEKSNLEISLRERVKELNCLYRIAELVVNNPSSLDKVCWGVVSLLPISWQYPEITSARIIFKGEAYVTSNFRPSKWKLDSDIVTEGVATGIIEVYYLKKMPTLDEGPFLREERHLIDAVSERIGRVAERINITKQLEIEKATLKSTNIALHDVLEKIQNEKKMIGASIQANVNNIIFPILYALEKELNQQQKKYLSLLKNNLEDIISPFADKVLEDLSRLTPVETMVCNMIKNGLTTKEIAQMRKVSPDTVNRHREHIRRKLGLTKKKINLVSYLNNISPAS